MATKQTIKAAPRARTGSGRLNQMRREGWLPAVVYGRKAENQNLKVNAKGFAELLAHSTSENILINLEIEGVGTSLAFLQAIQHDPLSGSVLHADFLAVTSSVKRSASRPAASSSSTCTRSKSSACRTICRTPSTSK
jgi:large subunit ribosomal protein L25